jgi:hypothetical protein
MEPMKRTKPPVVVTLTPEQRVKKVLLSQGKRPAIALDMNTEALKQLESLCAVDGTLATNTRERAKQIIDAHYDCLKATVDDTDTDIAT